MSSRERIESLDSNGVVSSDGESSFDLVIVKLIDQITKKYKIDVAQVSGSSRTIEVSSVITSKI